MLIGRELWVYCFDVSGLNVMAFSGVMGVLGCFMQELHVCNCLLGGQSLEVTSLPEDIFSGGSETVVEGSVVWLYCQVNSTASTLTVTWSKDGASLVQDVPHIRMRSSSDDTSTTLLLVLDNLQASDSGVYRCTAQDGGETARGNALTLTGLSVD